MTISRVKNTRLTTTTLLFILIPVMFVITVILNFTLLTNDHCNCPPSIGEKYEIVKPRKKLLNNKHKLAVLVPYRERFEELIQFTPYMNNFLIRQSLDYDIFILNQVDQYRFNRASLLNAGFLEVQNEYDYVAMHDVDLLPLNYNLSYAYPVKPVHLAAPHLHPRYHYEKFIGGILLINREHFKLVNGLSNRYWGWGLEDDEFYVRLKDAQLNITRPENITTNTSNTFRHIHGKNRKRDTTKCYNQREVTRRRDRQTGLHDVHYNLLSRNILEIDGAPVIVLSIELICNRTATPWCDCMPPKNNQIVKTKT